jgi:Flp pilus assembly protein TadG
MMKTKSFIWRFLRGEKGAVEIIAAVSMAALLGISAFAIDLGVSYAKASSLQNALDSAALAAVKELPAANIDSTLWNNAKTKAVRFANLNNLEITSSDITPVYRNNAANDKIIGVKITKSITVDYSFAKVFGVNSGTVTRSSTASLKPLGALSGAVPLSITSSALSGAIAHGATTNLLIKCSSDTSDIGIDFTLVSGWFGALRLGGSGASDYSNNIAYGYSGQLQVGQILDMESGNMSGPTLEGFNTRNSQCSDGCTASSYEPGCPKLVYIPVVNILPGKKVRIVAFAPFFLTGCGGSGNNSYITATYLGNVILPNGASAANGEDFGVYVTKLIN